MARNKQSIEPSREEVRKGVEVSSQRQEVGVPMEGNESEIEFRKEPQESLIASRTVDEGHITEGVGITKGGQNSPRTNGA